MEEDWRKRCKRCGKIDKTTRHRTFTTKNYIGPCADSFCYASCDSSSCRPISEELCDKCEKEMRK